MKVGSLLVPAVALLVTGSAVSKTAQHVRITMTASACRAAPVSVEPGVTAFAIVNRTRRPRLFTIAGRRTRYVKPRRQRTLRLNFSRTGVYRYFCISRGPRPAVRTGVVGVRPRPLPPPPPPEHRIGIRQVSGTGEFYDRQTSARFVPRGNTYLRRADQELPGGRIVFRGSTFIGGRYDSARVEAALAAMQNDGYDSVRVILDVVCRRGCLGDFAAAGLRGAYLDNLTDFLRRAKEHGLYVLLANDGALPAGTTWAARMEADCCTTFAGTNLYYLSPGGVEGTQLFWKALLSALNARGAPLGIVFGYSLVAEAYYEADEPPLSLTTGTVTTANGRTYDLASAADRQRMMDENLVSYADRVRAAIHEVDPTALVGMGFLWPQAPNPARAGDPRVIRTGPVLNDSTLDFVDLHLYPGLELTFPEYVENFELPPQTEKPVVLGEYGAFKSSAETSTKAATMLVSWQRESCAYDFDGWLLWSWDTTEEAPGAPDLWTAVDEGGVVERALAPRIRPDPCS